MTQTRDEIRKEAEERFKHIQSRLVRIQADQKSDLATLNSDKKSWESWLGAISFSLAAIGGAVLASPLTNYWALLATVLFLTAGIWIALTTKKRFEQARRTALDDSNAEITLEVKERDILWDITLHPEKASELGPAINQVNIEKIRNGQVAYKRNVDLMEQTGVDYTNDVWLSIVITGIYALIVPTFAAFLGQLRIPDTLIPLAISLPWFVLVILLAFDTTKSVTEQEADLKAEVARHRKNIEKNLKFADAYEKNLKELDTNS